MKTIIITGGNSGLGFETAKRIAMTGGNYSLILACRDSEKGNSASERLISETHCSNIRAMKLDLASLESVRDFAAKIDAPVYALDNNAGISGSAAGLTQTTIDGLDVIFQSNHLGHFLLTNLLLPKMTDDARILNISSDMHNPPYGSLTWNGTEAIARNTEHLKNTRYFYSKLCNLYFTYELDRRLHAKNSHITCNALNPGFMPATNLQAGGALTQEQIDHVRRTMPERCGDLGTSASAAAELLTSEEFAGISGKYYSMSTTPKESSELSYNVENARELWEMSEKLCGLSQ